MRPYKLTKSTEIGRKRALPGRFPRVSKALSKGLPALALAVAAFAFNSSSQRDAQAADHNDPRRVQSTQFWNTRSTEGADTQADIADLFAWNQMANPRTGPNPREDSLVLALTWRVEAANQRGLDRGVRYGIHIDSGGSLFGNTDGEADWDIWIRHGQDPDTGKYGVKVENIPGASGPAIGEVGTEFTVPLAGNLKAKVLSGLVDDPFVFDFDGFFYGLSVGQGNEQPDQIGDGDLRDGRDVFRLTENEFGGATKSPDNVLLRVDRPFGFNNQNDTGAGLNVHAVVIQLPLGVVLEKGSNIINVWATSARPSHQVNKSGKGAGK